MQQADREFLETLWSYYAANGRHDLPWRQPPHDPYAILVSELMLQQTQVGRVVPKFEQFMRQYPTVQSLAAASLGDVLVLWSGLGYNRRAKFLWQAAQHIVADWDGVMPRSAVGLQKLPGVGVNTAGAIMAYAYNQPMVFIETNVRTVLIHHYFSDQDAVGDAMLRERLDHVIDREQPREFYWAVMDYGTHLKKTVGNMSRQSSSYSKQSAFVGSRRQVRGAVLRALATGPASQAVLSASITDERLVSVLDDLHAEGLISKRGNTYQI